MLKMLGRMWRKRQRSIDLDILWPACLDRASDLNHAKSAFAVHVFNDSAWTRDFTEQELIEVISRLPSAPC